MKYVPKLFLDTEINFTTMIIEYSIIRQNVLRQIMIILI